MARLLSGRGCGVVLGGGGARGLAHLGVLEALDDAGVPLDAVGGTSIGALVGMSVPWTSSGTNAAGSCLEGSLGGGFLFSPTLPFMSLSSGRKSDACSRAAAVASSGPMDVRDCWSPFFCVSASITRAVSVVHDQGHLATPPCAPACSLPGLLPPVRHGEDLLLDGGLLNNLPVDVMRERLDGGTVIAVDLGVEVEMRVPERYQETPTGWEVLALRLKQRGRGERVPSLIGVLRARQGARCDPRGAPAVDGAPGRPPPSPAGCRRPLARLPGGPRPRRRRLPVCLQAAAGDGLGGPSVVTRTTAKSDRSRGVGHRPGRWQPSYLPGRPDGRAACVTRSTGPGLEKLWPCICGRHRLGRVPAGPLKPEPLVYQAGTDEPALDLRTRGGALRRHVEPA